MHTAMITKLCLLYHNGGNMNLVKLLFDLKGKQYKVPFSISSSEKPVMLNTQDCFCYGKDEKPTIPFKKRRIGND